MDPLALHPSKSSSGFSLVLLRRVTHDLFSWDALGHAASFTWGELAWVVLGQSRWVVLGCVVLRQVGLCWAVLGHSRWVRPRWAGLHRSSWVALGWTVTFSLGWTKQSKAAPTAPGRLSELLLSRSDPQLSATLCPRSSCGNHCVSLFQPAETSLHSHQPRGGGNPACVPHVSKGTSQCHHPDSPHSERSVPLPAASCRGHSWRTGSRFPEWAARPR